MCAIVFDMCMLKAFHSTKPCQGCKHGKMVFPCFFSLLTCAIPKLPQKQHLMCHKPFIWWKNCHGWSIKKEAWEKLSQVGGFAFFSGIVRLKWLHVAVKQIRVAVLHHLRVNRWQQKTIHRNWSLQKKIGVFCLSSDIAILWKGNSTEHVSTIVYCIYTGDRGHDTAQLPAKKCWFFPVVSSLIHFQHLPTTGAASNSHVQEYKLNWNETPKRKKWV